MKLDNNLTYIETIVNILEKVNDEQQEQKKKIKLLFILMTTQFVLIIILAFTVLGLSG